MPISIPIHCRKFKPSHKPMIDQPSCGDLPSAIGGLIIATIMRTNSRLHSIWHVILSPERKTLQVCVSKWWCGCECVCADASVTIQIHIFYYFIIYCFITFCQQLLSWHSNFLHVFRIKSTVGQPELPSADLCRLFRTRPFDTILYHSYYIAQHWVNLYRYLPPPPTIAKTRHKWRNCVKVEKRFLAKCAALNNAIKRQTCRYFFVLAAIIQSHRTSTLLLLFRISANVSLSFGGCQPQLLFFLLFSYYFDYNNGNSKNCGSGDTSGGDMGS